MWTLEGWTLEDSDQDSDWLEAERRADSWRRWMSRLAASRKASPPEPVFSVVKWQESSCFCYCCRESRVAWY